MKHMPVFYCDCVKSFYEQRFSIVIIICKLVPTFEGYGHVRHYLCDLNKILLIIAQECRPGWAYRLCNRWFIGTQRLPVFCLRILIFWVLFITACLFCLHWVLGKTKAANSAYPAQWNDNFTVWGLGS